MSDIVIRAENIGKQFHIGALQKYDTLRDRLADFFKLNRKSEIGNRKSDEDVIWALKDVNFEIKQGEVVGVIGRNGAGKSTLLKILSKITEPTVGRVELHGRVGSLLEVGTGFHPELTGRENVFLNGAILGMKREEIKRRFDEIVAFSEVEKFIDTPVKHYSSGMYMRLAFAVAAHLEPEILLVDEVLSVGDLEFQKKCLGKMDTVSKSGRTILFVSHNMSAIRQLCLRSILLDNGAMICCDSTNSVVQSYIERSTKIYTQTDLEKCISILPKDPAFMLMKIELSQNGKTVWGEIENGKPLKCTVDYKVLQKTTGLRVFIDLCDAEGGLLFRSFHDENSEGIPVVTPGRYLSCATIPENVLAPINYRLYIKAGVFNERQCMPDDGVCLNIHVTQTGKYNKAYVSDTHHGKLSLVINWQTKDMVE